LLDEVDEVLVAVDDGVEGPADVVEVHPQIPGEVVAESARRRGRGRVAGPELNARRAFPAS
jgi:hypothetical protein